MAILSHLRRSQDVVAVCILRNPSVSRLTCLIVTESVVNESKLVVETELLESRIVHQHVSALLLNALSVAVAVAVVSANELIQIHIAAVEHLVSSGDLGISELNELLGQVTTLGSLEDSVVVVPLHVSKNEVAVLCGSDKSPVRRNVNFLTVDGLLITESSLREDTSLQEVVDSLEATSELNGKNTEVLVALHVVSESLFHGLDEGVHLVLSTSASLSLVDEESNFSAVDVSVPGVQVIVSEATLANVDSGTLSVLCPNFLESQLLIIRNVSLIVESGEFDSLDTTIEELGLQIDAGEHLGEVEVEHVHLSNSSAELSNLLVSLAHSDLDLLDSLSVLVNAEDLRLQRLDASLQSGNSITLLQLVDLILQLLLGSGDSVVQLLLHCLHSSLLLLETLESLLNVSLHTGEVLLDLLLESFEGSDLVLHLLDSSGVSLNGTLNFSQTAVDTGDLAFELLHLSGEVSNVNLLGVESIDESLSLSNSLFDSLSLGSGSSLSSSGVSILLSLSLQLSVGSLVTIDNILDGSLELILGSSLSLESLDGSVETTLLSLAVGSALFLCSLQVSNLLVEFTLQTINLVLETSDVVVVVLTGRKQTYRCDEERTHKQ